MNRTHGGAVLFWDGSHVEFPTNLNDKGTILFWDSLHVKFPTDLTHKGNILFWDSLHVEFPENGESYYGQVPASFTMILRKPYT
jgi:hypothetical protein